jgi:hypothetical protein
LQSTTRAEGCPLWLTLATTIALGFGWSRRLRANSSHSLAVVKGLVGSGLGKNCTGTGMTAW